MRAWAKLAVLLAGVVTIGGGPAGAASLRPPTGSDHRVSEVAARTSHRELRCRFRTVDVARTTGRHRGQPVPPPGAGAPATAASVTVEIPPVVLIQRRGRDLDVFTNTGSRPQAGDQFYAVGGHGGAPADAALVRQVVQQCAAAGPTSGRRR